MATWDFGGGCACGTSKYCTCGTGQMDGRTAEEARKADNIQRDTMVFGIAINKKGITANPETGQGDARGEDRVASYDAIKELAARAQQSDGIDYKYGEDQYIEELKAYIDKTYEQHYSKTQFQSTEFIFDNGHGVGFCVGNIMKYAQRYGRKGTKDEWRKDVLKILHYSIMLLHVHDSGTNDETK